jgi:hypothetical protein
MGKIIDLTGKKFGKLTVLKMSNIRKNNHIHWDCLCDCGATTLVGGQKLRNGHTTSCGCMRGQGKGDIKSDPSWMEDLTGERFNKLKVLCIGTPMECGTPRWKCLCDCGNISMVTRQSLKRGTTKSCGCHVMEIRKGFKCKKNPSYKHGYTRKHRLWNIYHHMLRRCYNKNSKSYKDYGGNGITVCDKWKNDIVNFIEWSLCNGYADNLEIDRIDNTGPYAPYNCQFITKSDNIKKMHYQKSRSYSK